MDVLDYLLRHRDAVGNRPVQPAPGFYGIFADVPDCLPDIDLPSTGLIYVGRSTDLGQRDHFNARHSGFHTFRRSIGAILKTALNLTAIPRAPGPSPTNYRCFRFTEDGEERLTRWMRSNLQLATCPFDGDTRQLEKRLIREAAPPLNLTNWPNPQRQNIMALRARCRDEAKLHAVPTGR